jgi:hypothetical protein
LIGRFNGALTEHQVAASSKENLRMKRIHRNVKDCQIVILAEGVCKGYEWGGVGFIPKTGKCTKTIYRYLLGGRVLLLEELAMTSTTIARLFIKENVQNHLFY